MDAVHQDKTANFIMNPITQALCDVPNVDTDVELALIDVGCNTTYQLIGILLTRVDRNTQSSEIVEWFSNEFPEVFKAFEDKDKFVYFMYALLYKIDVLYPGAICFDNEDEDDLM